MKVEIIRPSGYCSGVALAMNLAKKIRQENPTSKIVVLGMLVHNNDALKELDQLNIETLFVKDMSLLETAKQIEDGSVVILTAHGHSQDVEDYLNERGLKYFDATCPFVSQSHKIIKDALQNNKDVIYVGKKGHPEANAALSLGKNVHLVEFGSTPSLNGLNNPVMIGQTTLSEDEINLMHVTLSKANPNNEITLLQGVCTSSTQRQRALVNLSQDVELIYVVGGTNSNNTKTLYSIAVKTHANAKVLMIENDSEINKRDLKGLSYIAISSGASTPNEVIEAVKSKIELLCN